MLRFHSSLPYLFAGQARQPLCLRGMGVSPGVSLTRKFSGYTVPSVPNVQGLLRASKKQGMANCGSTF